MTYRELLEEMHERCLMPSATDPKRFDKAEAIEVAIKALEKQIPMGQSIAADGYADGYPVWEYRCQRCGIDFDGEEPGFCTHCGQAIEWGEI